MLQYDFIKISDENIKIQKTVRKPPGVGSESFTDFLNVHATVNTNTPSKVTADFLRFLTVF